MQLSGCIELCCTVLGVVSGARLAIRSSSCAHGHCTDLLSMHPEDACSKCGWQSEAVLGVDEVENVGIGSPIQLLQLQ